MNELCGGKRTKLRLLKLVLALLYISVEFGSYEEGKSMLEVIDKLEPVLPFMSISLRNKIQLIRAR
jgi:hypothetical protein